MSEIASRSFDSAAPMRPGVRWCRAGMPLKQWVTSCAPASAAACAVSSEAAEWPMATSTLRSRNRRMASTACSCSGPRVTTETVSGSAASHSRSTGRTSSEGWAPCMSPRKGPSRWAPAIAGRGPGPCGRGGHALQRRGEVVERRGDERRNPCGHALCDQVVVEALPIAAVRVRHVDVVDAVDLEVDEAGHERARGHGTRRGDDVDDGVAVDLDHTRFEHTVGCDHARRSEGRHPASVSRRFGGGSAARGQAATGCFHFGLRVANPHPAAPFEEADHGPGGVDLARPHRQAGRGGSGVVVVVKPLAPRDPGQPLGVGRPIRDAAACRNDGRPRSLRR